MSSSESDNDDDATSTSENEASENEEMEETEDRTAIREDLKNMTFEEIMKLKEELGSKVYNEAVLGVGTSRNKNKNPQTEFKRLNKNRPREASCKRQVPFLGAELRKPAKIAKEIRDPRFDENAGTYDTKQFKENYKFLSKVRQKEISSMRKQLRETKDPEQRKEIKDAMQRLLNKNVEDRRWHEKQKMAKEEKQEIMKARAEGKTPHYLTKKERRAKELVHQFEKLKNSGKLNKHLEKRRKKMVAKDRKKIGFD